MFYRVFHGKKQRFFHPPIGVEDAKSYGYPKIPRLSSGENQRKIVMSVAKGNSKPSQGDFMCQPRINNHPAAASLGALFLLPSNLF